jgi:G3E family GTPase
MGIESPLMQDSEGNPFDKFYELPNGCICCSAKDDLLFAIESLIKNEKYNLDFILVETNGLADPSPVKNKYY